LEAIAKMRRAISEYVITGIETTLMFGDFVMQHPAFIEGKFDTHFIQHYFTGTELDAAELAVAEQELLSMAAVQFFQQGGKSDAIVSEAAGSNHGHTDWYLQRKGY
jgi:acetyl/propionyl-CoA carboxylase alpha subunit